ncbi:tyrosine-type recombinase/integrase [Denitratisoma oestradiolicum]|uniref:Site-specific recombinase, phage integrase family n=1 Tax=Denitratisoma oestradiolicum TaxID=311182 RepID=A0A6S6YNI9_9PROT|nr:tyrosine-type recombinase/integrase [Denitratisoma oestradiolicum]CAB1369328.1 Site-specific recombinase, phage integrase family [Denitratisoma oestradiolicum]
MHAKHGAYYLVRSNKWTFLSRNLHDALVEYARLTAGPDKGALGELVSRALADMKLTVAPSTFKNYSTCSRRVLEAFAEFTPPQIKPHHVARFMDDNKATPSMANLLRSFLKGLFQRAVRWGIVESNPVRDIEQFKTEKRDRYITAAEYAEIRKHATPTLACLMDIAYITGQRMGDCRHIRYADISEAGVFVKQQKTKARVLIAMTPDLAEVIARAKALHQSVKGLTLFHRRDGMPIPYGTLYHQWANACRDAKVEDAHFHDIRAAAATDAKAQGLDSKTLLGHTTESSHNRYLRSKETKVAVPNRARKS